MITAPGPSEIFLVFHKNKYQNFTFADKISQEYGNIANHVLTFSNCCKFLTLITASFYEIMSLKVQGIELVDSKQSDCNN